MTTPKEFVSLPLDEIPKLLDSVFKKMNKRHKKDTKSHVKIYFSGSDGSYTKFEKASNNLNIGVLETNEELALAMLFLVRIIVDDNDLFEYILATIIEENITLTPRNIIKAMSEYEKQYSLSFKLDEKMSVAFTSGKVVERKLQDVDIWNWPRIYEEITDYLEIF